MLKSSHYAKYSTSERLQGALQVLRAAGDRGLTSRAWCFWGNILNPGEAAWELRMNGFDVRGEPEGENEKGRDIWRWRYYPKAEAPNLTLPTVPATCPECGREYEADEEWEEIKCPE